MACGVSALAVSGLRFQLPRWGVRGSLFAAFAVIAGMAIVIAPAPASCSRHLGATMIDLSGRDIPRLAASLQLSAAEREPWRARDRGCWLRRTDEALNERTKKMKEIQQLALAKLGEIIELGADKTVVTALTRHRQEHRRGIKSLVSAARERLEAGALHDKQYERCARRRSAFVAAAGPGDAGRPDAQSTRSSRGAIFPATTRPRPPGPSTSSAMSSPTAI